MGKYTKAELEEIIAVQWENLTATYDLVRLLKERNELLERANEELREMLVEIEKERGG